LAEFLLTPSAERDLESIWRYSSLNWGADEADDYIEALLSVLQCLADLPNSAPACNDIRVGYRRRHFERHIVYCRTEGRGIVVVRVLHDRMDAARHLP
jgi:toxin ParE1/3/4